MITRPLHAVASLCLAAMVGLTLIACDSGGDSGTDSSFQNEFSFDVTEVSGSNAAETAAQYLKEVAAEELGGDAEGLLVEPTVLSDMENDMAAACNEHFGPVAPVVPFGDDDEAVELANDTEYGLAASVHSERISRAREVADRIDAGMVHINDQPINNEPHVPFGGMKASGIGRYNGEWIIDELTETKWTSIQHQPRDYPF